MGTALPDNEPLSEPQESWLLYIERQIKKYPAPAIHELLQCDTVPVPPTKLDDMTITKVFALLASLAALIKKGHHFSIDNALRALTNHHLKLEVLHHPLKNRARALMFHLMAIITMMYSTELNASSLKDPDQLRIDKMQCVSIEFSEPADIAELPFCEMIQSFGPLLPVKDDTVMQSVADPVFSVDSLYVSLLNASTLTQIGEIQIQWIDNISSHLQFDSETRVLKLFCLPSFAEVNSNTTAAVFILLQDYYDVHNRPKDFTSKAFLKEIRQSYHLIFSDESLSRSLYMKRERKWLDKNGYEDKYRDQLCGTTLRTTHGRNSYSKTADFPILAARLSRLQDYILRQNPKSLRMIWRDKRNPYQWYTFWAVIYIGGFGILLSLVQVALSAAQVHYAAKGVYGDC
ncbi:hypothetical protein FPOA_11443 [Fusarium poae]|uniref:Uncharacterized protein n=1 Tax=Fusarium poae TaxID=36050 RepID=A0A1B8AGV6_FUSPO|nr:hypothetical protein FPOA_11443 [Fusarium poae]